MDTPFIHINSSAATEREPSHIVMFRYIAKMRDIIFMYEKILQLIRKGSGVFIGSFSKHFLTEPYILHSKCKK